MPHFIQSHDEALQASGGDARGFGLRVQVRGFRGFRGGGGGGGSVSPSRSSILRRRRSRFRRLHERLRRERHAQRGFLVRDVLYRARGEPQRSSTRYSSI